MTETLADRTMLVRLSISSWSAKKSDRKAGDKLSADSHAERKMVNAVKRLISCDALDKYNALANVARQYHNRYTMPWEDDGVRILPVRIFEEYMTQMAKYKEGLDRAVDKFIETYDDEVRYQEARLGSLFDPKDYPTKDGLRAKFKFDMARRPVPTGKDFRLDMQSEAMQELQVEVEERLQAAHDTALRDIWQRAYDTVNNLYERMSNVTSPLRTNTLENVKDITKVLDALNFADDPDISKINEEIRLKFCSKDINSLRNDPVARTDAADEAQRMLNKMSGYFN